MSFKSLGSNAMPGTEGSGLGLVLPQLPRPALGDCSVSVVSVSRRAVLGGEGQGVQFAGHDCIRTLLGHWLN